MREQSCTDGERQERNWSELPQDILHLFSKRLSNISDFVCFRAVCKSWQLSTPVTNLPPQLPWLLECCHDFKNPIIRFYCLSSGKVHTITCPGSRHAILKGPACRFLLASHFPNPEMYLLNPLTHDQIHVPFANVFGLPNYIGPDPIEGGDIVVIAGFKKDVEMILNTRSHMIAFWRPKADNWVCLEGIGNGANAFYRGQYFSNDERSGITNVIDIATKKLAYQVAPPEGTNPLLEGETIIVESGGKILRLFHFDIYRPQCLSDIYCLYLGNGELKPYWVKITDIGDQMLFLRYDRGLSFCASNFAGYKGNCIYFLKEGRYLCKYEIGNDTSEVLPCPFDFVGTWFVPSLV